MRYISLADVKEHIGITGSSSDDFLKAEIRHGEAKLDGLLSVSRLDIHKVSEEVVDATNKPWYDLKDLQVTRIGEILDYATVYSQDNDYDIDYYRLHLENRLIQGKRKGRITYVAGWSSSGYALLTVSDYSAITSTMTIAIAPNGSGGSSLTEGTDWNASTDNNTTAESIASAINTEMAHGDVLADGIRAFALENVVYIIDEQPTQETSEITVSSLSGLSLESGGGTIGTTSAMTMDGVNFPPDLLEAVCNMIGARYNMRKTSGIKAYKVGSKSVTFSNGEQRESIRLLVKPYMRAKVTVI